MSSRLTRYLATFLLALTGTVYGNFGSALNPTRPMSKKANRSGRSSGWGHGG